MKARIWFVGALAMGCSAQPLRPTDATALIVEARANGALLVDGSPVRDNADLARRVKAAFDEERGGITAFVVAQRGVDEQLLHNARDAISRAGVRRTDTLFVDPSVSPPPGASPGPHATPVGEHVWACPFPHEATREKIDGFTILMSVVVAADGRPAGVQIYSEPGPGFGRAATVCALRRKYRAAVDAGGAPVAATTPMIRVRFVR